MVVIAHQAVGVAFPVEGFTLRRKLTKGAAVIVRCENHFTPIFTGQTETIATKWKGRGKTQDPDPGTLFKRHYLTGNRDSHKQIRSGSWFLFEPPEALTIAAGNASH